MTTICGTCGESPLDRDVYRDAWGTLLHGKLGLDDPPHPVYPTGLYCWCGTQLVRVRRIYADIPDNALHCSAHGYQDRTYGPTPHSTAPRGEVTIPGIDQQLSTMSKAARGEVIRTLAHWLAEAKPFHVAAELVDMANRPGHPGPT